MDSSSPNKNPPYRLGFTLIEMLMVVAIVAILAAIAFPAYSNIRAQSENSRCLSNLRIIGLAFHIYASENDGVFPAARFREDRWGNQNPTRRHWQFEINPYLEIKGSTFVNISTIDGADAVFCPVWRADYDDNTSFQSTNSGGYGMNPNLNTGFNNWDDRPRVAAIPNHSETILLGDSDSYHLNVLDRSVWDQGRIRDGRFVSGAPDRHGNHANYLFVDNRVESLTREQAERYLIPPLDGD